ncbi:hypothetical protein E2C01_054830 [Portunus trituberculatus]|uniref:Uncharacterized protein n=1 Tax=Portunus trituberculatus TaxID=210409 RepID=A0A5B7GW21_PORTR|nr:hypothetical protein [Portunus trituberculatus]
MDCTHVFIRVDAVHLPLTQPYCVLRRTRKTVTVDKNGSVDPVKPAYLLDQTNIAVLAATTTPESKPSTKRICFSLPYNYGEGDVENCIVIHFTHSIFYV